MDQRRSAAQDHLRIMDQRIHIQRQRIASLQLTGSDASEAAKILKLLEDTKAEMRVQLRVLGDPASPHK